MVEVTFNIHDEVTFYDEVTFKLFCAGLGSLKSFGGRARRKLFEVTFLAICDDV
jgi:hypothetical protein